MNMKKNRSWKRTKVATEKHRQRLKELRADSAGRNDGIETATPEEQAQMIAQAEQPVASPVPAVVSPICILCQQPLTRADLEEHNIHHLSVYAGRFAKKIVAVHRSCPTESKNDRQ